MNYAIIKEDTIIDIVIWDGNTTWDYPLEYDEIIEDENFELGIGMKKVNGEWVWEELNLGYEEI